MIDKLYTLANFITLMDMFLGFLLSQILGQVLVKPCKFTEKIWTSISSTFVYFIFLLVFFNLIIPDSEEEPVKFFFIVFAIFACIILAFVLLYKHKTKYKIKKKIKNKLIKSKAKIPNNVPLPSPIVSNFYIPKARGSIVLQIPQSNNNKVLTEHEQTVPTREILQKIENWKSSATIDDFDPMLEEAIKLVVDVGQGSTSLLQRRLRLGYARAVRLIDTMEKMGIVGPHEGSRYRKVLMTPEQWIEVSVSEFPIEPPNNTKMPKNVNIFIDEIVAEEKKEEYERLLNEFINYAKEYINYFFELEDMSVSVSNIYANHNYKTVTAELDLSNGVRVGQVKYHLGSLAKYLNVKYVIITNDVTDLSKLGIEISYPTYLTYYQ